MKNCWLIGAGSMAQEYSKYLVKHNIEFKVIGRGKESAEKFTKLTGIPVQIGGITDVFISTQDVPHYAIVAVNVIELYQVTKSLITLGVKRILVEKPGSISKEEIDDLIGLASQNKSRIYIAYNRRFYDYIDDLNSMIDEDGGILSFHFEFTELTERILALDKNPLELQEWMIANSSHVIDLAFFIGGNPTQMNSYVQGGFEWYEYADRFVGSGLTNKGALFTYNSNWRGPGNWSLEFVTRKRRFKLSPMEEVKFRLHGSFEYQEYIVSKKNEDNIKAGISSMLDDFFSHNPITLKRLTEQAISFDIYHVIQNGSVYRSMAE